MQFLRAISTAALFVLFGTIVPAYAQHEQEKQAQPEKQQSKPQQGARPSAQQQRPQAQPQRPQAQHAQQQQKQPAQQPKQERAQGHGRSPQGHNAHSNNRGTPLNTQTGSGPGSPSHNNQSSSRPNRLSH